MDNDIMSSRSENRSDTQSALQSANLEDVEGEAKRKLKSWGRAISVRNSSATSLDSHSDAVISQPASQVLRNSAEGHSIACLDTFEWIQSDIVYGVRSQEEVGADSTVVHDTKTTAQLVFVRRRSRRQPEVEVGGNVDPDPTSGDDRCDQKTFIQMSEC
jgi:hypothetical protein